MDEQQPLEQELKRLRAQEREDFKLIERAAVTLAEIDRSSGLSDVQADVLAALRIRVEGKPRKSLEDLLTAAGDIKGKRDLGSALDQAESTTGGASDWPEVKEQKKEWPGL
jgi:hypothetical protein